MLKEILFGSSLSARGDGVEPMLDELDRAVLAVIEVLRLEHGERSRGFKQAEREIMELFKLETDLDAIVACKRGILLYALWRDPVVGDQYRLTDAALVDDLQHRVLPLVGPLYLSNIGQRPDAFVAMCATMTELWEGEEFKLSLEQSRLPA